MLSLGSISAHRQRHDDDDRAREYAATSTALVSARATVNGAADPTRFTVSSPPSPSGPYQRA